MRAFQQEEKGDSPCNHNSRSHGEVREKAEAAMLLLMEELMEASMRPPPTARQSAAEWSVILSSLARTRRGPGMPVTTPILHIPKSDLAHLKVRADLHGLAKGL